MVWYQVVPAPHLNYGTRIPNLNINTLLLPAGLLAMAMDGSGDCKDEMKLLFSLRHLLRYRSEFQWQCVFSERD